jgi:hypothetical protein
MPWVKAKGQRPVAACVRAIVAIRMSRTDSVLKVGVSGGTLPQRRVNRSGTGGVGRAF